MIPQVTAVRMTGRKDRAELPLLVLGPALGTSATALWADCASRLSDAFDVLAWDLPGHGHNRTVPDEPFTMSELAAGVLAIVDEVQYQREDAGSPVYYAGDSVGGVVGLQLLLDSPQRISGAALLCAGAKVGDEARWSERIRQVRASGTSGLVAACTERWFGPGFLESRPDVGARLLQALEETVDEGYLLCCGAIAESDVRDRLGQIRVPVLAVAGAEDVLTPPRDLREIATGVQHGTYAELDAVAHVAPAEAPAEVASLLRLHFLGETASGGDDLTHELQQFMTDLESGRVWSRPGLDRRTRSLITLAAQVSRGQHEELVPHLRTARDNGITLDEIKELLLQIAAHWGLPETNHAYRVAQQVLVDLDNDSSEEHP